MLFCYRRRVLSSLPLVWFQCFLGVIVVVYSCVRSMPETSPVFGFRGPVCSREFVCGSISLLGFHGVVCICSRWRGTMGVGVGVFQIPCFCWLRLWSLLCGGGSGFCHCVV